MKFVKSTCWIFTGLILATSGVYAQDAKNNPDQPAAPASAMTAADDSREKPLREAETLMKAGKSADAYNLLLPLEFSRSGEVRFDYLIGIAALDSGKPDKATLAFERVLAVDPNFAGARLDMARAYYQLGDMPRSKNEFETVAKQNPPQAARATIQKYLDAIAAQQTAKQTRYSTYIEGGIGRDNNVNNSTSQSQVDVPGLGNLTITLSPTNLKTADNYYHIAAGGEISHNLNTNWGLYAGGDVRQHGNKTQHAFDTRSLDGRAGVTFSASKSNIFRFGGMVGRQDVARIHNRDSTGVSADWRHIYSATNQVSIFAQRGRNLFKDPAITINNFNQTTVGTGWLHVLADGKSMLFGSLFRASEDDVAPISPTNPNGGRADGNKLTSGLRVGGQTALNNNTELFGNLSYQLGRYDKSNLAFLRKRQDRQLDISAGANWHWDKNWLLRPQLNYSRNNSNIVLYSYNRTDFSLTIRREFR
jgi:hypothetical protein